MIFIDQYSGSRLNVFCMFLLCKGHHIPKFVICIRTGGMWDQSPMWVWHVILGGCGPAGMCSGRVWSVIHVLVYGCGQLIVGRCGLSYTGAWEWSGIWLHSPV